MSKKCIRMTLALCGMLSVAMGLPAGQKEKQKEKGKEKAAATVAKPPSANETAPMEKFKALEFRELGPAVMGGRVDDFAAVESTPSIVFVGVATGGIWKTVNNGITWEAVFDKEGVSTIGDIAIAPSDPSIVWVGTGEPNNRQSSSWGDGIYKSTDGGKTWKNMGLAETRHIGRVVIHPRNPDVVYVAALGHLWGANPDRGVYKTTDGGKTWNQVLKISNDTGVSDIAMDPESPDTLYAAAYQRRRTPFGFNGGGTEAAIYKTTDGGASWKKLAKGLPYENGGQTGRIGLEVYRKDPNIVYAVVQHEKGGIYRSEDKGETWKKMGDTNPRPSYYSQVRIDPNNDLRIWVLGAAMFFSEDGGKTFNTRRVQKIHGDFHALWIDPANSNHIIAGSDGGIHWSYDNGKTWDFINSIAIGQFYEIGLDNEKPYHVCGGLQDNGSWCGPSATISRDGIANEDWTLIHGGDGFYAQIDNVEPWTVYSESPVTGDVLWAGTDDGNLQVTRDGGKTWNNVASKVPGVPKGTYVSRVVASKYAPGAAYVTFDGHRTDDYGVYIFATSDYGETWRPIRNGIPDTAGSVHVVREHPRNANLLFAGTEFGLWISWDHGANWVAFKNNFPTVPVDDIELQARENDLVLGTHGRSIWIFDDLTPLEKMDATVAASDLTFFAPRIASVWHVVMRRWSAGQKAFTGKNPPAGAVINYYLKTALPPSEAKTETTKQTDAEKKEEATPQKEGAEKKETAAAEKAKETSQTPEAGKEEKPAEKKEAKVKITVTDKEGKVIRELEGPGAAGVNRTNWDLRYDSPAEPTPEQLEAMAAGYDFGPRGPFVEPGEYSIKIKAGDQEAAQKVTVEEDPRLQLSAEDRAARRAAIEQLYVMAKSTDKDRKTILGVQSALKMARENWKKESAKPKGTKIPDDIVKTADELQKKVDLIAAKYQREQQGLGNAGPPFEWKPDPLPSQVQDLLEDLDAFAAAPGGQQKEKLAELTPLVSEASAQVKKIVDEDLAALNKKMNDAGIPHIVPAPPAPRGAGGNDDDDDR
ncbi:MAG: hypothetical protein DMG34_20605 [Acidobacteria bacterium]|nr:MAG: hypothetical protein DMG34_20605 [Acidobacteriota bacterium]